MIAVRNDKLYHNKDIIVEKMVGDVKLACFSLIFEKSGVDFLSGAVVCFADLKGCGLLQ